LVAVLLLGACQTSGGMECRLLVIPVRDISAPAAPDSVGDSITTDCPSLSHNKQLGRFEGQLLSRSPVAVLQVLSAAREAEQTYFDADPAMGRQALLAVWKRLAPAPWLLPSDSKARRDLYRILLILLRDADESLTPDPAEWLAHHLSEQVPSVLELPPKLAHQATQAVQRAREGAIRISVAAPQDCPEAVLFMDGLALGGLPLTDRTIPPGLHGFWVRCQMRDSWVRVIAPEDGDALPVMQPVPEWMVGIDPAGFSLDPSTPLPLRIAIGKRLLARDAADGILFIPSPGEATVVIGKRRTIQFPPGPGPRRLEVAGKLTRTWDWKRPAKWSSLALATGLALCGGGANFRHDALVRQMDNGTVDNRTRVDNWRSASVGCYVSAGLAAGLSATLFVLDALPPDPVVPLLPD
jgi:hypothetical protein